MNYRRDIDGLRAIAVLAVVFFHVDLGCPGGYVGVDVFFVISGYLITRMLSGALREGNFRPGDFWQRRIRRLFPALLIMLLITGSLSALILVPQDQINLAKILLAQPLLAANVMIWRVMIGGYFGDLPQTYPILHTWSLAVEEQFYLFYPLLMMLLITRYPRVVTPLLVLLALLSCGGASAQLSAHPTRVFQLLPFRAWELLVGCVTACLKEPRARALAETLSLVGAGLIAYPIFHYTLETPFPGLAALPPCLGAALLLCANAHQRTLVGRCLSLPPMVGVGLISYSLYLWHWPLICWRAYLTGLGPLAWWERLLLVGVSLLAGWLSWRFVEKPCRYSAYLQKGRRTWALAGAGSALILALGATIWLFQGFPTAWSARALAYSNSRYSLSFAREVTPDSAHNLAPLTLGVPPDGRVDLIVWGDSHAMALAPALDELARRHGVRGLTWTRTSTPPVLNQSHPALDGPARNAANEACRQLIRRYRVRQVVLAAYWNFYVAREPDFGADLVRTAGELEGMDVQVWIARDVPRFPCFPPLILAVDDRFGSDRHSASLSWSEYERSNREIEAAFAQMPRSVRFLDPASRLKTADGFLRMESGGVSLFRDDHHLSNEGAAFIRDSLQPLFRPDRK